MAKKPSLGRQKIAIAKIMKKNHLQVTFSKRRSGLFKKASELCTLCGVEIGLLVFSPAHKAFTFGHPEVDPILDRFLACNNSDDSKACQLFKARRTANIHEMNMILTHMMDQLEAEKKHGMELDWASKDLSQYCNWWEHPIEDINNLNELEQLRSSLKELKMSVVRQTTKLMMNPASFTVPFLGPDYNEGYSFGDHIERNPSMEQDKNNPMALVQYFNFAQEHGLF